jgi:hypothetical protein
MGPELEALQMFFFWLLPQSTAKTCQHGIHSTYGNV